MTPTPIESLRNRVDENLAAHLDCTQILLSAIESEHQALLSNDIDALERLTATKAAAAECLGELGSTLNRLRGESGCRRIDDLVARCDPSGASAQRWEAVIELAARCSTANRENAALLDARQQQIRGALQLIGAQQGPATYGRGGYTAAAGRPRALGQA